MNFLCKYSVHKWIINRSLYVEIKNGIKRYWVTSGCTRCKTVKKVVVKKWEYTDEDDFEIEKLPAGWVWRDD